MSDVLKEIFDDEELSALLSKEANMIPMYILTNRQKLHGSACIVYENLLSDIADCLDSDLYILPSSIHEVILIPSISANSYAYIHKCYAYSYEYD